MSATNDKPPPLRKHKSNVEWPILDLDPAGLFGTTEEIGEGHDKWNGDGWNIVKPWIKIHPPSPAALVILTVGLLSKRTRLKKKNKAQETAGRSGGPQQVSGGQTCSVP